MAIDSRNKLDKGFYKDALADLEKGKLSPYINAREVAELLYGKQLIETLQTIRELAKNKSDNSVHGGDYKRIYRMANKVINEILDDKQLSLDITSKI